jgi:hypothetical protein
MFTEIQQQQVTGFQRLSGTHAAHRTNSLRTNITLHLCNVRNVRNLSNATLPTAATAAAATACCYSVLIGPDKL